MSYILTFEIDSIRQLWRTTQIRKRKFRHFRTRKLKWKIVYGKSERWLASARLKETDRKDNVWYVFKMWRRRELEKVRIDCKMLLHVNRIGMSSTICTFKSYIYYMYSKFFKTKF